MENSLGNTISMQENLLSAPPEAAGKVGFAFKGMNQEIPSFFRPLFPVFPQ